MGLEASRFAQTDDEAGSQVLPLPTQQNVHEDNSSGSVEEHRHRPANATDELLQARQQLRNARRELVQQELRHDQVVQHLQQQLLLRQSTSGAQLETGGNVDTTSIPVVTDGHLLRPLEDNGPREHETSTAQALSVPIASVIATSESGKVLSGERRQRQPSSPTRRCGSRNKRRSTYEKAQRHEAAEEHLLSARQRGGLFLLIFLLIICIAMTHSIYESVAAALNRAYVELPPNDDVQLPSLNLFDYDKDYSYPIFPEDFPIGLQRKIMPQMPDKEGKDKKVWDSFLYNIEIQGGNLVKQIVDLRFTRPLQSELSGHIVFNVLFGDTGSRIREKVEADPHFFAERIILVRTPEALIGSQGEHIPAGTLLNLDGHHTNEVLKHCARIQHPSLRHGYIDNNKHICGKGFRTRQTVLVIENVHPLTVIDLALEAGASSGQGLIAYDQ
ncbi:Hypothetical Protein FCC1311_020322 [Hondaea fermentalgiana]|uniref:Uncharacterized protein n=1 Tax=Hondaea fermentalgiana TaxID=2315210 RepID=A0A2R5GB84_9STRA|nr:Hypothetical Protein FCC1311_020322 [Hondaea fermentalgiana]|eukprot:GBG25813.1 Hypothetical Protein FCC1311_020322 [Hondaea fermentalgiana]